MKKIITAFLMLSSAVSISFSQNLQLHYDFRHSLDKKNPVEHNFAVATFEMYHPDKYGSTFFFADFDFSARKGNLSCIYTEIAREFKIGKLPVLPHIEYNGGVGFNVTINNAYMIGGAYPFRFGKFHFNTYAAYKYNNFETSSHDIQFTTVWNGKVWKDRISICGVVDLWTENKRGEGESGKKFILYSEPQFWYNFNNHLSIGTEVKISSRFYWWTAEFKVYPTLGIKYNFR